MDRFEAMGLFVAAAEAGSFSAAGRKLGVPLPTVSRKVNDLETHLNARLLVRTTRKLALTDAGAAVEAVAYRLGAADDIAAAVCFLASDEAAYITGQVLAVNGGMYL